MESSASLLTTITTQTPFSLLCFSLCHHCSLLLQLLHLLSFSFFIICLLFFSYSLLAVFSHFFSLCISHSFHPQAPLISFSSIFRNMFGGDNNNLVLPVFVEGNRFQYENNALPQLQRFGDCPLNNMANGNTTYMNRPIKRSREAEPTPRQQKYHMSVNNNLPIDEAGPPGTVLNPNPVSIGLRLSYEEDEHNSSVTSVSGKMTASLPVMLSLGDNLKAEIDRQKEEFDHFIKLQEESILKGVRDLKQRQTISFLNAIEKGVVRKLQEKELEIENLNRKNKELVEKIKQVSMEVQSWHYRAKYNEYFVNVLKSNLKQVMEQGAVHGKEGSGESEVDDAASYTNHHCLEALDGPGNPISTKKQIHCRACKSMEVSMLLLPCRHLCLCKDCEGFIEVSPVCQVMKTASVQIYMSGEST